MFKNIDWKAVWETTKMVTRFVVLALPLLTELFLDLGWTQAAASLSAILIVVDKLIHEWRSVKATGLVPF